jgi:hypothetical protein
VQDPAGPGRRPGAARELPGSRLAAEAGGQRGDGIEALQRLAPVAPVRSLRQGSHVVGGDGTYGPEVARLDHRTGYGHDVDYTLTEAGSDFLGEFGVRLPERRRPVRYCVGL